MGAANRTVVIAGATSASGVATARALLAAGATVVAVGSHPERLTALEETVPGLHTRLCDLSKLAAVTELAEFVAREFGGVDGVINLVGGWRGRSGIVAQTDDDWAALESGFTTLRNTSRAFHAHLLASTDARFAIVSSTAVDRPTAGGASYAASKAAAEAWVAAVADDYRRAQSGNREHQVAQRAAAVRFVITAFVTPDMRAENPDKAYATFTDVSDFGDAVVALWESGADELNGTRIPLTPRR